MGPRLAPSRRWPLGAGMTEAQFRRSVNADIRRMVAQTENDVDEWTRSYTGTRAVLLLNRLYQWGYIPAQHEEYCREILADAYNSGLLTIDDDKDAA